MAQRETPRGEACVLETPMVETTELKPAESVDPLEQLGYNDANAPDEAADEDRLGFI